MWPPASFKYKWTALKIFTLFFNFYMATCSTFNFLQFSITHLIQLYIVRFPLLFLQNGVPYPSNAPALGEGIWSEPKTLGSRKTVTQPSTLPAAIRSSMERRPAMQVIRLSTSCNRRESQFNDVVMIGYKLHVWKKLHSSLIYWNQGLLYHRTCKGDFLCSWPSLNSYLE